MSQRRQKQIVRIYLCPDPDALPELTLEEARAKIDEAVLTLNHNHLTMVLGLMETLAETQRAREVQESQTPTTPPTSPRDEP